MSLHEHEKSFGEWSDQQRFMSNSESQTESLDVKSNINPQPELLDFAARLENEMERREDSWRNFPSDPHNINTAVMVACAEVKTALRVVLAEITKRAPSPEPVESTPPQAGHSAPKAKPSELVNTEKEKG